MKNGSEMYMYETSKVAFRDGLHLMDGLVVFILIMEGAFPLHSKKAQRNILGSSKDKK